MIDRWIKLRAIGKLRRRLADRRVEENTAMRALQRRTGIVSVQPYGVGFPMRAGSQTNITCIQTLAGFEKLLGRRNFTSEELRVIFRDKREDCEALASLLYDADEGEPMVITPHFSIEPIKSQD
jgi:hypothetical protein